MKKVIDASFEVIEGPRPPETIRGRARRGVGRLIWVYWGLMIIVFGLGGGGLLLSELLPEDADKVPAATAPDAG